MPVLIAGAMPVSTTRRTSMPEVHVNRGAILMLRKQAAEALACFDAALRAIGEERAR